MVPCGSPSGKVIAPGLRISYKAVALVNSPACTAVSQSTMANSSCRPEPSGSLLLSAMDVSFQFASQKLHGQSPYSLRSGQPPIQQRRGHLTDLVSRATRHQRIAKSSSVNPWPLSDTSIESARTRISTRVASASKLFFTSSARAIYCRPTNRSPSSRRSSESTVKLIACTLRSLIHQPSSDDLGLW